MLSDEQKEQLATEIIPFFQELEQDVIKDIARRVHKTDRWTETAELQVKALEKLGYSPAKIQAEVWKTLHADPDYKKIVAENTLEYKHEITKKINDIVKQAQAAGDDIIGRAGNMDFADDVDIWAAQGRHLKKSPALEQIGGVMAKRLRGDLKTLSQSTGFRTMGMPVKVTQAYNHALDRAITNVASGAFSSAQAVEMAMDEMEKSGLRKIDFASGVTRNLDVAAMLAVRTTIRQMAGEISLANAESLGTDLVEVSSHPGARTGEGHGNHAAWQGKVYSISGRPHPEESKRLGYTIEKLSDATGYPDDPAGLKGYNCRHDFYPFIEGASEPNPMAKEPDRVTIDGKTYTYYQATQKQRAIERELRELKRRYIGGRQELAGAIKAKEQQYARYCEKAGLKQNLNRLYVKGYKRDFQYIKIANKRIEEFRKTISIFYEKGVINVTDGDFFELGCLPTSPKSNLLDGSKVYIEGKSLRRILNKHGKEMSFDEFMLIEDTIRLPDFFADNSKHHENSLLLYKKIPNREKRYVECAFVKHGENFVIHYHKMHDRKLKKLSKANELIDFTVSK